MQELAYEIAQFHGVSFLRFMVLSVILHEYVRSSGSGIWWRCYKGTTGMKDKVAGV
jgi:hypothetical protein